MESDVGKQLRSLAAVVVTGLLAMACAATQFSIPAVTGGSQGNSLPGKIVWHDLLTDTPVRTRAFYNGLFGWEFQSLPDGDINYEIISHRGQAIGGMVDQTRLPNEVDVSQWVALMSVADIDAAALAVADGGGEVLTPPTSLGDRGKIAIITDSQGALLALLETEGDPLDDAVDPVPGGFLWDELWTIDVDKAVGFLAGLAPFEPEVSDPSGVLAVQTQVLRTAGRPRVSVRSRPIDDLRPRWVNYLMVADEAQLLDILSRVGGLGGQVLVDTIERPSGGYVALITGPSGAGIALQTWSPDEVGETQQGTQL